MRRSRRELAPFIEAALEAQEAHGAGRAVGGADGLGLRPHHRAGRARPAEGPTHHIAADITVMMDDPRGRRKEAAGRMQQGRIELGERR